MCVLIHVVRRAWRFGNCRIAKPLQKRTCTCFYNFSIHIVPLQWFWVPPLCMCPCMCVIYFVCFCYLYVDLFVFMFLYMCICLHIYFECVFFVCNFEYFCIHNLNCLACICILIILQVMCICILHFNAIILCFVCFLNSYVDVFNKTKVFVFVILFSLYFCVCVSFIFQFMCMYLGI